MDQTAAINWLKLLHGYAPGIRNQATLAEKIAKLEKRTKTPRIQFDHPASAFVFRSTHAQQRRTGQKHHASRHRR